jgi:hypothetical protein
MENVPQGISAGRCGQEKQIPVVILRALAGDPIPVYGTVSDLDLARICAAPSARLSHCPFEGDRAFPAQC